MNTQTKKSIASTIWNFEFQSFTPFHKHFILLTVTLGALTYVVLEVLLGANPFLANFTLFDFIDELQNKDKSFQNLLLTLWLVACSLCILIRMSVIFISYKKSQTTWGESVFMQYFLTYFISFGIAFIAAALVQTVIVSMFSIDNWLTGNLNTSNPFSHAISSIELFFNSNIPNLINIESKWLSFVISVCLAALAPYCIHRLSHSSRFCWLVMHRAHHCPMHLHPLAAPPAYVFSFLTTIPSAIIAISISRLIHTEALVMELAIWFVLTYCLEIFNHADVLYRFAYSNTVVRNLCRLSGDSGVYHLVHHSSLKEDQNINFAGGPLNLWDRVFGTYRKPYPELPPLGLTHQPDIHLNPFRIIFGGIFQLAYELRMNKSVWQRFMIIFGGINYKPDITHCYLKK